ncbi:adenine deaminase [Synergistaceae bacterium OttesenSCG-928-I11]|nr:adenine deaminase [Synergistaceae bacterium OttesenSCG-928-I11]
MKNLLAAARGEAPSDLVIKGGRIANVLSLEYEEADIAVKDGIIVGIGEGYNGIEEVDADGNVLMPGMIDGHLHIESTMLAPATFAGAVVPLGTTTIMPDPHEIANTCGLPGIEFMWRESLRTPLDAYFAAPSCVPASPFETPYQEIETLKMMECYDRGWCTHMGEMMNFPGVIAGDEEIWGKITTARGLVKTAHLPNVTGRDLCTYLISGCNGDHESNFADEAREKLRRGIWVMIREGATEHNLEDVAQILLEDEARYARCMAVSDDLTASHILFNGHMDHKVRLLIDMGIRPLIAAALVTINPAQYFRLWDRGAIAPGMLADIVMVPSLEECRAMKVWKRGVLVADDGNPLFKAFAPMTIDLPQTSAANIRLTPDSLKVRAEEGAKIRVIEALPGKVLTNELTLDPLVVDGHVESDRERDILKMVVVEKNQGTGRIAIGFVKGFGLKKGAIASSVAHDAHNYIAVAADDRSMLTALQYLIDNHGGLVTTQGEEVSASLPLPIGGLMSNLDAPSLSKALLRMIKSAEDLGTEIRQPFMALSFLSLSVIPELKLTDKGYVDLAKGGIQTLFVRE